MVNQSNKNGKENNKPHKYLLKKSGSYRRKLRSASKKIVENVNRRLFDVAVVNQRIMQTSNSLDHSYSEPVLTSSSGQLNLTNSSQSASNDENDWPISDDEGVFDGENQFNGVEQIDELVNNGFYINASSDFNENLKTIGTNNVIERNDEFKAGLVEWANVSNIPHIHLKSLLAHIQKYCPVDLPIDPRTLLNTPRELNIVHKECGDDYWHYGFKRSLLNVLPKVMKEVNVSKITIIANVDGLPLFKSSKIEVWPILYRMKEFEEVPPMVVGIYRGKGKIFK